MASRHIKTILDRIRSYTALTGLEIWTKVKEIEHTDITYLSDNDKRLLAFSNGELTEHELVNACFTVTEQVSEV